MGHCLQIQEIVGLWCAHLEESTIPLQAYSTIVGRSWNRPALKDLAVVARTCKAFHGPALDALWRSSPFENLLRCMPSDLYRCEESGSKWNLKCDMTFLRPIRVEDWDRVLIYAPRVRHLFSNSYDCDLSKVLPAISACLPMQLFPGLQRLHWGHSDNDFQYIHLFLGPGITELSFAASCSHAKSFLTTVALRYSALKTVAIRSDRNTVSEAETKAVSVFLRGLTHVETLSVDSIDEAGLKHICHLPTITVLRVGMLPMLPTFNAGAHVRAFAGLRNLYVAFSEIDVTARLLGWCKDMPLESLTLEFINSLTGQETQDLFDALSASVLHSNLTRISLISGYEDGTLLHFPDHIVPGHSVRPLFNFTNLTSVLILTPVGIDLDNATVSVLARAWPRLERLDLSSYYYYSPAARPRATLECLLSFAAWCPRLEKLCMTFDGTVIPSPQSGSSRVVHSALKYLHVEHSPISTALSVARFLSGIFVVLADIRSNADDDEDELMEETEIRYSLWNEVKLLLPELFANPNAMYIFSTLNAPFLHSGSPSPSRPRTQLMSPSKSRPPASWVSALIITSRPFISKSLTGFSPPMSRLAYHIGIRRIRRCRHRRSHIGALWYLTVARLRLLTLLCSPLPPPPHPQSTLAPQVFLDSRWIFDSPVPSILYPLYCGLSL
ncbi:hypothetical protein K438DRAFT_1981577 [Mycena galopus ATCC 62051]|nr:hypothetical protein K438DRAFT_1981577 [Mycena galopus ATCC 62051]